jgi:hypothetical protein
LKKQLDTDERDAGQDEQEEWRCSYFIVPCVNEVSASWVPFDKYTTCYECCTQSQFSEPHEYPPAV